MRLNGSRYEGSLSSTSTTEADEMMEREKECVLGRVADLEKKVSEQGDEIVCLRSTLADVLRRLHHLEAATPTHTHTTRGAGLASKEPQRRAATPTQTPSSLPQRVVHYQSTGSLHSDSPSSSSVSPPPPAAAPSTPSPRPPSSHSSHSHTPLGLSKRWSSTGDFNQATPPSANANRLATKSLFNLYMKPNPSHSPQLKHGTHTAAYNEEEGTVRMWVRGRPVVLYAPSSAVGAYDVARVAPPPPAKLRLDWVFGYRGRDCRANLHLLPTGEMLYFVAAVVVLYDAEEQTQRHYTAHTDDVKCLAIHPNKLLVASGQAAGHEGRPHVRIWNSVSLNTVCVLGLNGEFERSVSCLSFSKADGGALLCAVDEGNGHNISVWDWQHKGHKLADTKCSVDVVVACEWHPLERGTIVSCGQGHIAFWTLDASGTTLYKRMGLFEGRDKPKYVTCLAFTHAGDTVSGDSNGNIIVWTRGTCSMGRVVRGAHEGSVFSVCVLKDGSLVSGGGKDGRLRQLDQQLQPTGLEAQIAEHLGGVRVVAEGRGSQLLVGSTRNCVLVGSLQLGGSFRPVVLGHTDELWALAAHPCLPQFLTAGYDRIVQLWDCMSHSVVWSKDIAEQAQSAAFSPDGSVLVVGGVTGRWLAMDAHTRELYSAHSDGTEPIQVVRFSPDGRCLALGSRDNSVYVYQVNDDKCTRFSRIGRCTGHSSFVTHLDWSQDSQHLRTNSGDYELLFWNAGVCRQVGQSASMRDVAWASQTCVLSFESVGVWPEGADGSDVNACARTHGPRPPHLCATADDFGKVKLYSFPASQPRSLCHAYGGHSSHVTNVAFLFDDSRLVSTGGRDTSVMQWTVVT